MPDDDRGTLMEEFFPNAGRLAQAIAADAGNPVFEFMPIDQYKKLVECDTARAAQVYWREMLYRANLAAVTALARHARWIEACLRLYNTEPNYLGLACCLRGLLESAADTFHSLRVVPLTIASSRKMVERAVLGGLQTNDYLAEDLENQLIHFIYARRISARGQAAPGHKAETSTTYIQNLLSQNDVSVRELYKKLCELTHPAADSVVWMLKTSPEFELLQFGGTHDARFVRLLVDHHAKAIKTLAIIPVDISVCTLRVLNLLPLPEIHVPISDAYEPAGWQQIITTLQAQ
jgi:hypothetical protein